MTYLHKFKCLYCSIEFMICSHSKKWPEENTTREQLLGEASGIVYCPECGSRGPVDTMYKVPGMADPTEKVTAGIIRLGAHWETHAPIFAIPDCFLKDSMKSWAEDPHAAPAA